MYCKEYLFLLLLWQASVAQSQVWKADLGNGSYRNPIIHADYSDPDVVRVGDDFFMTSSSFDAVPGLPILHSTDLVNWSLIAHALPRQVPIEHFESTQHGKGVWAPSIRYHNNEFYIYYPDPDFGIYLIKAKNARGPWTEPILVQSGKGLIDPCPLWDEDGRLYLVHAFAGSRAGIKSVIVVKELNSDGTKVVSDGKIVYDGHELDPTIEGPKFYKRNGYYYIFAPAGGVATGWQTVLRSKNVYGPYERKVVIHQGNSSINGPHQGAWITTPDGKEDWFIHFQDKEAYGRILHLQPMHWKNEWPVIGTDKDGDGIGEPVLEHKKPTITKSGVTPVSAQSDGFNDTAISLEWQWQANPQPTWSYLNTANGSLRLYAAKVPESAKNYWDVPNVLLQKFSAEEFEANVKLTYASGKNSIHERAGVIVLGSNYASLSLKNTEKGLALVYAVCKDADKGSAEAETTLQRVQSNFVYVKVSVKKGAITTFSFSADGKTFQQVGTSFEAVPGRWIGTKIGLFCTRNGDTNDAGYVDVDWFRVNSLTDNDK